MISTIHSQENVVVSTGTENNRDNEKCKANKKLTFDDPLPLL